MVVEGKYSTGTMLLLHYIVLLVLFGTVTVLVLHYMLFLHAAPWYCHSDCADITLYGTPCAPW